MTAPPPPLRAGAVRPAGTWSGPVRAVLALDFDERHRRRRRYDAEGGLAVLLDLPEAAVLRDGDALALDDGGLVAVRAAPEPLVAVTAAGPAALARLAWHLGNRHLPVAIDGDRLLIRDDHVIVAMLEGLGAVPRRVSAPFDPEGGAYGEQNRRPDHPHAEPVQPAHGHDHDHAHAHAHAHPHPHPGHSHRHG